MRLIGLAIAALALFAASPANAAWQTYMNEPLGYSVMFPGKPTESTGAYHADLVPNGATRVVSYKDGDASYVAMVIEAGRLEDGAIILGELEYWLGHIGNVSLSSISRLNIGMEYGRYLAIDCSADFIPEDPDQGVRAKKMFEDAGGLTCPDGARMSATMYYTQGRLYFAAGVQAGPNAKTSGAPARFVNSLNWEGVNAERARTMVDWVAAHAFRSQANVPAPPPRN